MKKEVKYIEIRDEGTCIAALAMLISGADSWLARRAGYNKPLVLLIHLTANRAHYSPWDWNSRTMTPVHNHLQENWDAIKDGDLIDSRVMLGEATEPCESERPISL